MRIFLRHPAAFPACLAVLTAGADAALQPAQLRTEWLENPLGIETTQPRLSWRVEAEERAQRQTAYRVLVASSLDLLAADKGDLWDSGKVASAETLGIVYQGSALTSRTECFWKLKVWDKDAQESPWSPGQKWTMGLLGKADWKAQWISAEDRTPVPTDRNALHLPPARQYRKDFTAAKAIKRATAYASALGIYELQLNGQAVSDAQFTPGWSDYLQRAYYHTFDVTALIRPGSNAIGATVADGWYAGYVGYGLLVGYGPNKIGRNFYGKTPALLAQLELEYADGTRETVVTDPSWQVSDQGPVREADLIMGESYDARREQAGWSSSGFKAEGWKAAIAAEDNGSTKAKFFDTRGTREVELGFQKPARMQAYTGPKVRVTEEVPARKVTEQAPGVYLFDLGQNFAGNIRLQVKGAPGTKVEIRYGEMLHPDGRMMTENLRKARATDFYTLRGDAAGETWTPRFTYHGFQYVELRGLNAKPELSAVTGLVLQSDTPPTSRFACADEVMTQFWKNTTWTQRANFVELPTDCPQRDERLGWMGDAQIYVRTATFNADVAAFFTKWLDDLEESQRASGAYPDYAPYPMAHGGKNKEFGTAWTDAGVICPWTIWQVYGDTRVIERHWASLERFMAWRMASSPDRRGVNIGNTWGDWLNVKEATPIPYIDACYFAYSAQLMSEMAQAIGKTAEAQKYRGLFEEVRAAFQKDYLQPEGQLSVDTQTAYVLALGMDLVPTEVAQKAADRLAAKVEKNGFRMATGFLGTKSILPVLTRHGHHDLAVRLFQSREFPSWGYEVVNGATSVWERWDSFTKEHGFNGLDGKQNAAMNSFSHYSFGAVAEWMFRSLAGIDLAGPGYRQIVLRPGPVGSVAARPEVPALDWVEAEYQSARGRIASAWKTGASGFEYRIAVPANTSALVYLPASAPETVRESNQPLSAAPGVKFLRVEGGRVVCEVQSGRYQFLCPKP